MTGFWLQPKEKAPVLAGAFYNLALAGDQTHAFQF